MFGTANANRGHFERGIADFALAEAMWPGWPSRLLTQPIQRLENYPGMFRALFEAEDAIKIYVIVSEGNPDAHP